MYSSDLPARHKVQLRDNLKSTMRGIRRTICNRSFVLGAMFAYGTVLIFIISHHPTPQRHSEDLRRLLYSTSTGNQKHKILTPLPVVDYHDYFVTYKQKEIHEPSRSNKTKDVGLPERPSSSSRPISVDKVNVSIDTVEPGKTTTKKRSEGDSPNNAEQVGETPTKENDGNRRGTSGREKEQDDIVSKNISNANNVQCIKSTKHQKYNPTLDCRKRLPRVIGIGIEKCGSGALTFFLTMHPNVVHSSPKELYYWNKHVNESLKWYRNLMPVSSKYQVTMEYTPSYIFDRDIPRLIKKRAPNTKFIVMLRDPIQRAVSQFLHVQHYHWEGVDKFEPLEPGKPAHAFVNETFETTVVDVDGDILEDNAIVENGLYDVHLQRWFNVFPRDRFLIVDGDEFSKDPVPSLRRVEAFLDLPPYFNEDMIYFEEKRGLFCKAMPRKVCLNKTKGRSHPTVREDVLQKLTDYYRPHNLALNSLLHRNFSWT